MPAPTITHIALLLGLSFFFGLAFEDFYSRTGARRPGGIRTFPLLAIAGGALYLVEPTRALPFSAGLLILGAWLFIDYRTAGERGDDLELIVPICNLLAYLLGPISLALPAWLAIGVAVAGVLLLTGRERLHDLARRIELREVVILGEFLILSGLVLPLLPDQPVTALTTVTPYKAWLALLAVCTISYASYLLRRYVAPAGGSLWLAALGGLYSSTATTVVLARHAKTEAAPTQLISVGIVLATALMYPRLLIVIAIFNPPLAMALMPPLLALMTAAAAAAIWQYRRAAQSEGARPQYDGPRNPLELSAAAIFAALFVVVSIVSRWVKARFGELGIELLAAFMGITDIDPFVLNLAQGVAAPISLGGAAAAVLIASASNNLLKAGYAIGFAGWRATSYACLSLVLLGAGAGAIAVWFVRQGP